MERRSLGRTGLDLSVLSFGCGAVGGLMVKGAAADQQRAVARAIESGINYFDTARIYGDGESERNLGRVLKALDRPAVHVGTKVWLRKRGDVGREIAEEMDASLARLGLDGVDLYQLHNPVTRDGRGDSVDPRTVRDEVIPAFERLRTQGKARHFGFTALGETSAILEVLDAFETAQVSYNLLNPSAAAAVAPEYPAQDYDRLIARAHAQGVGTIGIRVLAGGALSGVEARHPLGMQNVDPIGSATSYARDVDRGRRFSVLVERGYAESVIEAAVRYVISNPELTTTLVGLSTVEHLEYAARSARKGPLPTEALELAGAIQGEFVGQER
ncbi:MAG: hypothetical protein GC151_09685 [Betaproteobacteria bacterium]|nr:hypothetical protein [Betaproteobacteria bacterium]